MNHDHHSSYAIAVRDLREAHALVLDLKLEHTTAVDCPIAPAAKGPMDAQWLAEALRDVASWYGARTVETLLPSDLHPLGNIEAATKYARVSQRYRQAAAWMEEHAQNLWQQYADDTDELATIITEMEPD